MQRGVRSRLEFGVIVRVRVKIVVWSAEVRVKCRSLEFGVIVRG